jgi:hypothetical protein
MARVGTCALTGRSGKLVRSHLIPKALTDIAAGGEPIYEAGDGSRVQRKWDSWYDNGIVTRDGEDLLARLDSRAIKALRDAKLVWSAWGEVTEIDVEAGDDNLTVRQVSVPDYAGLRLFLLSLLWRAAATTRVEFAEIALPSTDVAALRDMLIDGVTDPLSFYPATVMQFRTRGPDHNRAPTRFTETMGDGPAPIYRFYFDGLMVHFFAPMTGVDRLGSIVVGHGELLSVLTIPFEGSGHEEGLIRAASAAQTHWLRMGYES